MQCNKCGKEFGEGVICQHCGVDRVTGLAGYHGYETPSGNGSILPSSENANGITTPSRPTYASQVVEEKTMFCYACNEVIPADSDFCPVCGQKLYVVCPSCGSRYSSKYEICNKCGTNRVQFEQQQLERERIAKEERLRKEKERKIKEEKERKEREQRERERKERERREKERKEREQRERERREKEQREKEEQYRKEVRELQDSYSLFTVITILIYGVFLFVSYFLFKIMPFPVWIIFFISVGLSCLLIAASINDSIVDSKMRKWKQEHPNDPRSKYIK